MGGVFFAYRYLSSALRAPLAPGRLHGVRFAHDGQQSLQQHIQEALHHHLHLLLHRRLLHAPVRDSNRQDPPRKRGRIPGHMLTAREYHGAGLDDGKDAAEDSRADEQLPLLAQMQVNVVQDHRQQNAPRLWRQRNGKRANVKPRTSRFTAVVRAHQPSLGLSPGKKKRRLSTVRAMDCSLTTSMD